MKLPKIEIKYRGTRRSYYINDVKVKPNYRTGVRPKVFLPEYGIVIKFNHFCDYEHDDKAFYKNFSRHDRQYFPKLIKATDEYTIHEYVPARKVHYESKIYDKADDLRYKYGLRDFCAAQIGQRLDNGKLVYFDYGFIG